MRPKLSHIIPLLTVAGLSALFLKQDEPATDPEGLPVFTEVVNTLELNPYADPDFAPEPVIGPKEQPKPNPLPELKPHTPHKMLKAGEKFVAILNKTNSFEELFSQAFDREKGQALIDIHFNKYKGEHSGPLIIYSKHARALAVALQREFLEIYEENGWVYDLEFDLRRSDKLALIKLADKKGRQAIISEFGYVDDPNNPIGEYIQTDEGQERIARAYHNAIRGLLLDKVVLSMGHHGRRGSSGATYKGYHEAKFAMDVTDKLFKLESPGPTGNPAEGYHHLETAMAVYENPVNGAAMQDLRKPAADYPETDDGWTEVRVAPESAGYIDDTGPSNPNLFQSIKRKIQARRSSRNSNCKT